MEPVLRRPSDTTLAPDETGLGTMMDAYVYGLVRSRDAKLRPGGETVARWRQDLQEWPKQIVIDHARQHLLELEALPPDTSGRDQTIADLRAFLREHAVTV